MAIGTHFYGSNFFGMSSIEFLSNFIFPVGIYALVVGLMAAIFYQDMYRLLTNPSGQIRRGYRLPIPKVDNTFYSTITKEGLGSVRRFCGYAYALSKPLISLNLGLAIVPLLKMFYG